MASKLDTRPLLAIGSSIRLIYSLIIWTLVIYSICLTDLRVQSFQSGHKETARDENFSNLSNAPVSIESSSQSPIIDPSQSVITNEVSTAAPSTEASTPSLVDQSSTEEKHTTDFIPTLAPKAIKCLDDNYCLNGGTCVLSPTGQMLCLCPEGFYGARCQTRNICQTVITASLTGDQICAKIDRECYKNDKFFRCSCYDDEYFLFKINQATQSTKKDRPSQNSEHLSDSARSTLLNIVSSAGSSTSSNGQSRDEFRLQPESDDPDEPTKPYLAECRKIDKCLGVRCRRLSEVCSDGECICNRESGYIRDIKTGLCKLLNPCLLPTEDKSPICGQAQCVATYDHELYRCVCPVGYKPLKVGAHKNSTQCVPVNYFTICEVPLLNKCQHICRIDKMQNHYKCSCLPGYRAGIRPDIDDHLCFFDEHVDEHKYDDLFGGRGSSENGQYSTLQPPHQPHQPNQDYVYRSYSVPKKLSRANNLATSERTSDNTFSYDPLTIENPSKLPVSEPEQFSSELDKMNENEEPKNDEIIIRREPRSAHDSTRPGHLLEEDKSIPVNINRMSAQERCNIYCEENKICVLEEGSTDSYRCICDRQGYVSVGDRCLDWCSAAEFSYRVRGLLDAVCLSGMCQTINQKPSSYETVKTDDEMVKLERESSWRPTFQCNCSSSPLLVQDPETKLCKLDFQAILNPCLPGNVGYIDCVENKNAYCAVLHRPHWSFLRDLQEKPNDPNKIVDSDSPSPDKPKTKAKDKLYTCVCSPEKKFLVDKPRNKARCVDECELLNVECGRFNRMCRPATIAPDDFGRRSLVRHDPDGIRMNFKRTGCECLPGFNVGPSETLDFTLDDNNPAEEALSMNPFISEGYPQIAPIVQNNEIEETEHFRAKYMNINSRCLLDYDVVEFHASFKAPADFDPTWVKISNPSQVSYIPSKTSAPPQNPQENQMSNNETYNSSQGDNFSYDPDKSLVPAIINGSRGSIQDSNDQDDIGLEIPSFIKNDISEFHKSIVLVAQCDEALAPLSIEAYRECIKYRYWIVQKLRQHFIDWRRVITQHLSETFDLMEGNIRIHVNKCGATLRGKPAARSKESGVKSSAGVKREPSKHSTSITDKDVIFSDPTDEQALVDADLNCELTLHSASDDSYPRYSRKVLLEKQLQKFIFKTPASHHSEHYYLMAPKTLIRRESFDQLAEHRRLFNPCKSDYDYCDKQTKCEMVDTVNFTCTCEYGYTPIGSRDIYYADSRKEVCEDINECLFDVCKELANVSTCINEIGDYRCQCNRHYTGDNKRFCTHVCNTIPCKHGRCRLVDDHHAFCECDDGYKETDCSVQDPNVALRKANMIICGSIFTSVLLLAITFAISLNSQLKKTKKKLKKMESFNDAARMIEFTHQQPFRPRLNSKDS